MERLMQVDNVTDPPLIQKVVKLETGTEYSVMLIESDEEYAVSCPELRGCHSQGTSLEEALTNINEAIRDWLTVNHSAQADAQPLSKIRM